MQTAIIYATRTKHSMKLAEAIGATLNVKAINITEKPTLDNIELLFVVGGIYGGESMPELLTYLKEIETPSLKKAAIVTSCASAKQKQIAVRNILEEKGIVVVDEFVCRGGLLFIYGSHPNKKDLKDAIDFAQKIINVK